MQTLISSLVRVTIFRNRQHQVQKLERQIIMNVVESWEPKDSQNKLLTSIPEKVEP